MQAHPIELVKGLRGVQVVPSTKDQRGHGDLVPMRPRVYRRPIWISPWQIHPPIPEIHVAARPTSNICNRQHPADLGPVIKVNIL